MPASFFLPAAFLTLFLQGGLLVERALAQAQAVNPGAGPAFAMQGFAGLSGAASNGTWQAGGTTGGVGGAHVKVSTLSALVACLQSPAAYVVEVLNDIDLSPLANHTGGFPAGYPVGEIMVRSNKTLFSRHGATLQRGTLRIGRPSLGPQKNIIIRNLRFRDLWVEDPAGNYDTYGWDYVHVEERSHHLWIDHCDFEKSYDGAVDMTHAADLATVSWNVFRDLRKANLIGHNDGNAAEDTGHLNVTFHHNYYVDVHDRMPRMRFGNAHVYNLFCENLSGSGIISTANAATLVENCYFRFPRSSSKPTREEMGGFHGLLKVTGSVIENLPWNRVVFRQHGAATFTFNAPFAAATPPYPYHLNAVQDVPAVVKRYAGTGKLGFVFWQQDHFTPAQREDPAVSGPLAVLTADGASNLIKYATRLGPTEMIPAAAVPTIARDAAGKPVFTYLRSPAATDLVWQVQTSADLQHWSAAGVSQQRTATAGAGLETWEARSVSSAPVLYFRLAVQR